MGLGLVLDLGLGSGLGSVLGLVLNWRSQKSECYDGCAELRSWTRSEMKELGGQRKWGKSQRKYKVEVVWACDEKKRTLRRKEGDGNESTWEKEERTT